MKFTTYTLLIILTTMFFPMLSIAENTSPDSHPIQIDHQKAVEIALGNNNLVDAAQKMVKSARAEGKAQYAPFLPQLSTTYSYTRLDNAPFMSLDRIRRGAGILRRTKRKMSCEGAGGIAGIYHRSTQECPIDAAGRTFSCERCPADGCRERTGSDGPSRRKRHGT